MKSSPSFHITLSITSKLELLLVVVTPSKAELMPFVLRCDDFETYFAKCVPLF
jgi:hypothetical protein